MNILLIGDPLDTKTLAIEVERGTRQYCHQMNFAPDLTERVQKNYWHLIIMAVNYEHLTVACDTLYLIKEIHPDSHVILISANKDVNLMSSALETGVSHFLVQPFSTQLLLEKLVSEIETLRIKMDVKRVLAIGAHPDDVEIGCGGTMLKHLYKGDQLSVLTLSNGEQGGQINVRCRESAKSADYMKAALYLKNLKDTMIADGPETIKAIEETIDAVKPDIIYTHSLNDNHQDHRNTYYATLVAGRSVVQIYSYLSPSCNIRFLPLRYEHIEKYIDNKIELISFFHSQKSKCPYLSDSLIRSTAEYWGRFSKYGIVEPFEVIRS